MEEEKGNFELFLRTLGEKGKRSLLNSDDFLEKKVISLIETGQRKKLGQFPTPSDIAAFMAKFSALKRNVRSILDPAIGTGILVKKLLDQRPDLNDEKITVTGYDIDPLMIKASKIALDPYRVFFTARNDDFMLSEGEEKHDVIVANPPYVKSNRIENKTVYADKISKELNLNLNGTLGLDSFFLLHSLSYLDDDGLIIFITPAEFLNSGYGKIVKKILLEKLTVKYFIYFETPEFVFEDGMSSALITVAINKKCAKNHLISFVKIHEWTGSEDIYESITAKSMKNPNTVHDFEACKLNPEQKWIPYFDGESVYKEEMKSFVPLSTLFFTRRGIATGANNFFTLSGSQVKKWNIPGKYLSRVLTKANQARPPVFTSTDYDDLVKAGKKVFLLTVDDENPEGIDDYLEFGRSQNIHEKYLTRTRRKWFFMEKRNPARILVKVFNRNDIQFILNETTCLNLTAFHGIYVKEEFKDYSKPLLVFLKSR
ncbi:MAG: HsdM family class I SAM-dependent methyltransferase, partial [Candidatus Hodarchaeales archaeon]